MSKIRNKNYYLFFFIAIISLVIALLFSFADDGLIYDSQHKFQLWRLMTAHLVHTESHHLIANLLAYALLIYLFPISWQKQMQVFIFAMVLINCYLIVFSIETYAGLSGVIYAIPGAYFFQLLKEKRFLLALIIILILMVYVFFISPQTAVINDANWKPLKSAHLLGFVAGFIMIFMNQYKSN
ncbi:MAG: rhomboid family intramembrane serine protease [Marinicellaceae bacterium]